jgi:hypothetical protein
MATGTETISLRWQAELGDLRRQMAQIPGITEKEAKAMARALDSQMKKAEKAAKNAAEKPRKSWRNLKSTITTVTAATTAVAAAFVATGSAVAALTKDVVDYRNELSDAALRTGLTAETLQALQQAAAGSGQELDALFKGAQRIPKLMADSEAGLATATRAFANLGVETHNTDGTMREADAVFKDVIASLGNIESDTERAARAMDLFGRQGGAMAQALAGGNEQLEALIHFTNRWGVSTAPEALEQASKMQQEIAALGTVWRGAKDALLGYIVQSSSLQVLAGAIVGYSTTAITFVDKLNERLNEVVSTFKELANAESPLDAVRAGLDLLNQKGGIAAGVVTDLGKSFAEGRKQTQIFLNDWDDLMDSLATASGTGEGGESGGFKGAANAADEMAKALERVQKIAKDAGADLLSDTDQVNNKLREQANLLGEIIGKYGLETQIGQAASEALTAISERAARDRKEIRDEELREQLEYYNAILDRARRDHAAKLELQRDLERATARGAASLFGVVADLSEQTAERQAMSSAEAGARWFDWYKRSAELQAIINGALAATKAIADYGLPWGLAAAAAAAGAVALEINTIESQQLPSYHTGGMAYEAPTLAPDEGVAVLRPGSEAVLTGRGVNAVGGEHGVNAANRGETAGGVLVVEQVYKHRVFGRVLQDNYRMGGPMASIAKQGQRVGHRRRS